MLFPPALAPGDRILVIAPSGPFDQELLWRGLDRLLPHFQVEVSPDLDRNPQGYLHGPDAARLSELQSALNTPDSPAILVARGGYGLARIAPSVDWTKFLLHPKWLVGFSDATVLHCALTKLSVASIHGPNGTTLSQAGDGEVDELVQLLTGGPVAPFGGLATWAGGRAEGRLFGGNLTVLFSEAAAGRLSVPRGAILLLEDVTETSYRIDRMLTALHSGGHLQDCAGIVLGSFTDCNPGKFDVPVEAVLHERLTRLGIPVLQGLPVGHGAVNRSLVLGRRMLLCGDTGSLCAME